MSVYSVAEASPSRVLGALRLVVASSDRSIARSALEMMMCPPGLTANTDATAAEGESGSGKALLQRALKETIRLGVLEEADRVLKPGKALDRNLISDDQWWPL